MGVRPTADAGHGQKIAAPNDGLFKDGNIQVEATHAASLDAIWHEFCIAHGAMSAPGSLVFILRLTELWPEVGDGVKG